MTDTDLSVLLYFSVTVTVTDTDLSVLLYCLSDCDCD